MKYYIFNESIRTGKRIIQKGKLCLLFSIVIFSLGFLIGYSLFYLSTPSSISSIPGLKNPLVEETATFSILQNNIRLILILISGSFSLGLTTFINLILNGSSFGMLTAVSTKDISLNSLLFLTLPHTILEVPAIIIAGAAGFKIPHEVTRYLVGKKDQILNSQDIKEYIALALISIALIVIAAWIETNITMRIAESMLNE